MSLKEEYQNKIEAQLNEWKAEIEKLKAKADQAEAETKIKLYEQIEGLRVKQQAAHDKLDSLKAVGENAWEELKAGVESTFDELKKGLENVSAQFK